MHIYVLLIIIKMFEEKEDQLKRLEEIRVRVRDQGLDPMYKAKSQTDDQFILSCLKNHFVFYNLSESELNNVRDYMWWTEINMNIPIFNQGDPGSCFFIIVSGVVEVIVDGNPVKTLKVSEGFGELALLYDIQRPSTVEVREDVGMWVIDRTSFREAVEEIVIQEFEQNQKYLEGIAFYQFLSNRQKEKVASSFITLKYYKGQNIIEEGDPGSAFYIIKSGTASLIQGNVEERKIFKGESFGINSLYYNTMRKMTVKADDEVVCQVLGRQTLAKIIGQDIFREVMFRNYVKHTLQKNKQLFGLIKKDEERVFENMKTRYYKTNQIVFKKGSIVHKLIIIIEGRIKKFRSANFLAQAGQIWGENYLVDNSIIRLDDDIIVETESVLIQLSLDSLRNVLTLVEEKSKPNPKEHQTESLPLTQVSYIGTLYETSTLSCHYLTYGEKRLIGKLYNKQQIQQQNITNMFKEHLQVVSMLSHPLLPQFYDTVDMDNHLLVLFDYVTGQSLYDVIRDIGLLSTNDAQFYVASMICLLDYLLAEEVVLRDLKPDNFVVDKEGHLHMVSLGSAKCIKDTHRTSTVVGTPHYMAPEVVLGKQYNEMVDLWAVGVMLYEFMVGELPFGAMTENPFDIYEEIIQGNPSFPRNFKDRRAKKLIENMLSLNPEIRHNGSYNTLRNNSWFDSINWENIVNRTAATPYKPANIAHAPKAQPAPLKEFLSTLK